MLFPAASEPILVEEGPEVAGPRGGHGFSLPPLPFCLADLAAQVPPKEDARRRHLPNNGVRVAKSKLVLAARRDDVLGVLFRESMDQHT